MRNVIDKIRNELYYKTSNFILLPAPKGGDPDSMVYNKHPRLQTSTASVYSSEFNISGAENDSVPVYVLN